MLRRRAPDAEVPSEIEAVIVRGLLADKQERYPSAKDLLAALSAVS